MLLIFLKLAENVEHSTVQFSLCSQQKVFHLACNFYVPVCIHGVVHFPFSQHISVRLRSLY